MKLFIKPHNDVAWEFYKNHGHFHEGDAGLDLYVLENIHFEAGETKAIKLGISCEPENGTAYYLFPRSSISKTPLRMANSIGLIDGGYRGEIMAVCDNIKTDAYTVEKGQRLFQIVATDSSVITYELVKSLEMTTRGTGGFGSTGV
jgi:dUTP pyrophosphatase